MRRLARHVFTLCTAVSLLPCIAATWELDSTRLDSTRLDDDDDDDDDDQCP
jgi:hypothetical protein